MKEYPVKSVSEPIDWDSVEEAVLSECSWSPYSSPKATAQAVFLPGKGIVIRLKSCTAPARAENYEPDSPVWEDSCLEFFFSNGGEKYVNLEANANAAMRASIGTDRHNRTLLLNALCTMPQVSTMEDSESWQVFFFIPCATYSELFGEELQSGCIVKGNFYSCGDKTPLTHYSAWNTVETAAPDFHRPEFFGSLILE